MKTKNLVLAWLMLILQGEGKDIRKVKRLDWPQKHIRKINNFP